MLNDAASSYDVKDFTEELTTYDLIVLDEAESNAPEIVIDFPVPVYSDSKDAFIMHGDSFSWNKMVEMIENDDLETYKTMEEYSV